MSAKHIHQADFRCCLWGVDRSTANILKGRGPRLRFYRIRTARGPCWLLERTIGGRLFKRATLNGNGCFLCETPEKAVEVFGWRAEGWRDRALAEAAWAVRDLAFVEHRDLESILRYAKEEA